MRVITSVVSHALALAAAALLLRGIRFGPQKPWPDELIDKAPTVLGVAVILALVAAVVRPVVTLLSLPLVILTLGLFLVVINALMLLLTAWIAGELDLRFRVEGFWWAVGGAIIITIVTRVVDAVIGEDR